MMTRNEKIDCAIELVQRADDMLGEALRMLNGMRPLASEHIVESQGQCLDAVTHMQTRNLSRKKKSSKSFLKK